MEALFEAFGLDVKLLIVQAVNFGVLIIALWYFLYRPVFKVLADRQAKIQQGVEDAEKATEKLATADTEAQARVDKADQEADEILTSAREVAGTEKARLVKEAEARAEKIEKDATARADELARKALSDSEKEIARLAVLAAGKALSDKK